MKLFPIKSLLDTTLEHNKQLVVASNSLKDIHLIGILFLVDWHPNSQTIVNVLKEFYSRVNTQLKLFELIFCSADENEQEYNNITNGMPWLIIPYNDKYREQCIKNTEINVMPTLLIFNPEGKILSIMKYEDICNLNELSLIEWTSQLAETKKRIISGKYIIGDKVLSICHPHQLTFADYLLKIPEYKSGNWYCDECGLSYTKNIINFYCPICEYDLCESCFQKNK